MNQKIIAWVLGILCLIGIAAIFFLLFGDKFGSNKPSTQNQKYFYAVSITYFKDNLTGTAIVNGVPTVLTAENLKNFAIVSFNNPKDIIWVSCPENYLSSNATTTSQSQILEEPGIGASLDIDPDKPNNISLICTQK